jgi:hypothetical protein
LNALRGRTGRHPELEHVFAVIDRVVAVEKPVIDGMHQQCWFCGALLTPILHGQTHGGIAQGVGQALLDVSALSGNSTEDILSGQYRCHIAAALTGRLPSHAIVGVNRFSTASLQFTRVISEIDIWRAANLMLKRYGAKAFEESSTRADELAADGDHDGASTWRRITVTVKQLANNVPPGPVH